MYLIEYPDLEEVFNMDSVVHFMYLIQTAFFPPDFIKHTHFGLGMVLVLVTFLSRQLVEGRVYLVLCFQRDKSLSWRSSELQAYGRSRKLRALSS